MSISQPIKEVWKEVFRLKEIKGSNNFFELGGHSLTAAKIVSALAKQHHIRITIADIFNFPTIDELVREKQGTIAEAKSDGLQWVDRSVDHPLSLAQKRLWFLYKLRPRLPLYSLPFSMRISGKIDARILSLSLNAAMKRHESLRTKIKIVEGEAYQKILPDSTLFPFQEEVIEEAQAMARINEEIAKPFDLERDLFCRSFLFRISAEDSILLLLFHHIIFDDWSMDVFTRELSYCYQEIKNERSIVLEPLTLQYLDFSVFQKGLDVEHQLDYWKRRLSRASATELPIDFVRPKLLSYQGDLFKKKIPIHPLKNFLAQHNVSLFIVLLACFKWALALCTRSLDIVVGSPISNRPFSDQKNVIGYFVNTLVLRTSFEEGQNFVEAMELVKATVLESYQAQDLPFEKIVSTLQVARELNKNPLFQVMFSIAYASEIASVALEGAKVLSMPLCPLFSKFDFSVHILVQEDFIECNFEYLTELFRLETISHFSDVYLFLVDCTVSDPLVTLEELKKRLLAKGLLRDRVSPTQKEEEHLVLPKKDAFRIEKDLLVIWKDLLRKETVGIEDNFFELGGSSLLTIQMCEKIKSQLHFSLSVLDIFQYPTIRSLAQLLANQTITISYRESAHARRKDFINSHEHWKTRT